MRRSLTLLAAIILAATSLVATAIPAAAATLTVDDTDATGDDGCTGTYPTIQAAIDASADTDTISVCPGTYDERLVVSHDVTITGSGTGTDPVANTILQPTATGLSGSHSDNADVYFATGASGATIEGFRFDLDGTGDGTGAARESWGLLVSDLDGPTVTDVTIRNNVINMGEGVGAASAGEGLGITTGKNADVSGLTISGNTFLGDPDDDGNGAEGIYLNPNGGSGQITISGNTFDQYLYAGVSIETGNVLVQDNSVYGGGVVGPKGHGIRVHDFTGGQTFTDIEVRGNYVWGFANGLRIGNSAENGSTLGVTVDNNEIDQNTNGVYARFDASVVARDNAIESNSSLNLLAEGDAEVDASRNWWGSDDPDVVNGAITDSSTGDVDFTPLIGLGTDNDAGLGFTPSDQNHVAHKYGDQISGVGPAIVLVEDRVQEAIDYTGTGGTVEVHDGTYNEDLTITTDGLTLTSYDGTPDGNVIKGVATQSQGSFPDTTSSTNIDLRADDVTISNLSIDSPVAATGDRSSGIVLDGTGITITGNEFEVFQAGASADSDGNTSVVIQTSSGAVAPTSDVDGLTISDNTFGGTPDRGYYGIYVNPQGASVDGDVTIDGNTIRGNVWRAITSGRSRTTISGNTLETAASYVNNSGIMVHDFGGGTIDLVNITRNDFPDGAGELTDALRLGFPGTGAGADSTLTNLTATKNTIANAGTGVHVFDSAGGVTIHHNSITNNSTTGVDNDDAAHLDAECNWWGQASGPAPGQVEGSVDAAPYLTTDNLAATCPVPPAGGGGGSSTADTDSASRDAGEGETVSTGSNAEDGEVEARVTTPNAGQVSIDVTYETDETADGFSFLGFEVAIEAPDATAGNPLQITFEIDASLVPEGENAQTLAIFRNGVLVPECSVDDGTADPDPCVSSRVDQDDGDVEITVLTSQASIWTAAEPVDACPDQLIRDAGFTDVAEGSTHDAATDCLAWWGITKGITATTYGPSLQVTRGQMASFIARTMQDAGVSLPDSPDDGFPDDEDSVHELAINQLAELAIIKGYDSGDFGPEDHVTRAQTASLVVRAYEFTTGETLPTGADHFTDDDGGVHEANINKAAEAGFVEGTSNNQFDPATNITRDQMASILTRMLQPFVDQDRATPPLA